MKKGEVTRADAQPAPALSSRELAAVLLLLSLLSSVLFLLKGRDTSQAGAWTLSLLAECPSDALGSDPPREGAPSR